MSALHHLSRSLRCAGFSVLADSVAIGARQWLAPFPWTFDVDGASWSVDWCEEHGWHATDGDGQVVTTDGLIVNADDPPDGHHTIRLPSSHWGALSQLGEGNASRALRHAVVEYLRRNGRLV